MNSSPVPSFADARPYTVVLHQQTGIGDLIWHIPYIRAVAAKSRGNQVALVASPSTLARQIMAPEICIDEFIDYYHLPRNVDRGTDTSTRFSRMHDIIETLRARHFDRIVLFSPRVSRGLIAYRARIPKRLGYGFNWTQRLFLNTPPYIRPYQGKSNPIYHNATAFCIAHGFCEAPILPKIIVPQELIDKMTMRLSALPRPLYALAVGSSEEFKQWGEDRFAELTRALAKRGFGVMLIGGKMDDPMAQRIRNQLAPELQTCVSIVTDTPILESAAAIKCADVFIGNDSGLGQIAAACDCPCYIIIGPRATIDHDPVQRYIVADKLSNIDVAQVFDLLSKTNAAGF